jgi:hypothetical protein
MNRLQQLVKENMKLKDVVYELENNTGDSRREEELSLIRGERDRLFAEKSNFKRKESEDGVKIKELETEIERLKAQFEIHHYR